MTDSDHDAVEQRTIALNHAYEAWQAADSLLPLIAQGRVGADVFLKIRMACHSIWDCYETTYEEQSERWPK